MELDKQKLQEASILAEPEETTRNSTRQGTDYHRKTESKSQQPNRTQGTQETQKTTRRTKKNPRKKTEKQEVIINQPNAEPNYLKTLYLI